MRKRRPVYFIFCEGKSNKTEVTYLGHFKRASSTYSLTIKPTDNTNPSSMLGYAVSYSKNHGYNKSSGDMIFLLCDVDTKEKRDNLIEIGIIEKARKKNVILLFSNPAFEIWFLNHFALKKRIYQNQKELIADLKKYLPEYEKNGDVYPLLDKVDVAIKNSKKQCDLESCLLQENAGTDFYVLVEYLLNNK
ncbi:MAG: RloB family protein [Candidatus Enterosoma sp.]|nr:RloB family protein [Candidatus Enterosoma sp.]